MKISIRTFILIGLLLASVALFLFTDAGYAAFLVVLLAVLLGGAALVTGLGVFDKIARHAGGGTLVPITGFANSIASAAMDSKSEGFITGVGVKIFTVAGPVILYGTAAGMIWGFVLWLSGRF